MDDSLLLRLQTLQQKLRSPSGPKALVKAQSPAQLIINKYRYKSKSKRVKRNAFLPDHLQGVGKPYENLMDGECALAFGKQRFLDDLKLSASATRHTAVAWESQRFNIAVISSLGWYIRPQTSSKGAGMLVLKCSRCAEVVYLKIEDHTGKDSFDEKATKLLCNAHKPRCARPRLDLGKDYFLNSGNLSLEYQRISTSLRGYQDLESGLKNIPSADSVRKLVPIFATPDLKINPTILHFLLKGYTFITPKIVECSGCYRRAFVTSFQDPDFCGHTAWCKYHDEMKLINIMLSSLDDINASRELSERFDSLKRLL
ncbi:LADA_0H05578g1_1 [Lachancea dasiensis]|uniref:LADA_0H05578g1_1 n=1 Tax=Lachancea dasiensis TaxID=1072105 RepID=A0A1G4K1A4_9SACH|nr:LADA_0H05578g1_1 [Lachancea dasiensis]